MRKLSFILLLILFSCSKENVSYMVKEGGNTFLPWTPMMPFKGHIFESTIMIGEEWFVGEMTIPNGYGTKLHAIGGTILNPNYHSGGCNFALSYTDGHVYLSSRYYEKVKSGEEWKLHEGLSRTEVFPNLPVSYKIEFTDSTRFFVRGIKVATVELLPHMWVEPPFCGRSGNDNNYPGGDKPGAFAQRDLRLMVVNSSH